jgi:hypothetical protein
MTQIFITSLFAFFAITAGCEEQLESVEASVEAEDPDPADKIDYSVALPEQQDGDFFRSVRQDPYRTVRIDLRNLSDLSGIPEVKWFPMGNNEFCAIQGTTDTTLILPSGRVIREEFAIVYVDKDSEGIFQINADSLGWLKMYIAKQRLDRELRLMTDDGADPTSLANQRQAVLDWLSDFDHNSQMRSAMGVRSDDFRFTFGFAVTMNTDFGISHRYEAEIPRSKEHRTREQKIMQNRVPGSS